MTRSSWPDRPMIMGILNITPDSFWDGGRYTHWEDAVAHGLQLVREGADILDIGGESTRPGAEAVPPGEELLRVLPVIRALHGETQVPLSIDTRKPSVAAAALEAGASWVNDVGGLRDRAMTDVVIEHGAGVMIMHMQGEPQTMQQEPQYAHVVDDVIRILATAVARAESRGVDSKKIWVDPGIGFGKNLSHNLALLAGLDQVARLGYPVVLGASRKRFIDDVAQAAVPEQRLGGSLAAASAALHIPQAVLRVHDVAATRQYLLVRKSIERGERVEWQLPAVPELRQQSQAGPPTAGPNEASPDDGGTGPTTD